MDKRTTELEAEAPEVAGQVAAGSAEASGNEL